MTFVKFTNRKQKQKREKSVKELRREQRRNHKKESNLWVS